MIFYRLVLIPLVVIGLAAGCQDPAVPTGTGDTVLPQPDAASNEQPATKTTTKPQTLDLELPSQTLEEQADTGPFVEQNALPNLFEKQQKNKKYSVTGKPLMEAENPDYVDAMQGAEVTIKMNTD